MAFALSHLCCMLLFCLPLFAVAQTNGNITIGTTLSATTNGSSSWLSFSGDFAFGFHQLGNDDLFLLAIWYAKIPDKTIVWYVNEGGPVSKGSKASLTSRDGLILSDSQGVEVWKSEFTQGTVAYAVMNDTGNLMLKSSNSVVLWESFKHPADTILPAQIMERGSVVSSRRSVTNFSTGRFQFRLQEDGNLVLNSINLPTTYANEPYYASNTYDALNSTISGYQLIFNESGYMYILRQNNQRLVLTNGDIGLESDFYYRATLNFDGVFTKYRYRKNSGGSWTAIWSEPDNICSRTRVNFDSGVCGYNSLCRLNTDQRPTCECPIGYSLLDPNDAYGSCKIDVELSCAAEDSLKVPPEILYKIEELTNINWPLTDYMRLEPFTEDQCRESCLHDCFCAVAIFGPPTCWKKKMPLSNGRFESGSKAFLKLRKDNATLRGDPTYPYPGLKEKDKDGFVVAGSVILSGSVFINFILVSTACYIYYLFRRKKLQKTPRSSRSIMETNLHYFTFKELVHATNGFKEELGRGAFGTVYKGKLQNGLSSNNDVIAVKKLYGQVQDGEKEFKAEMNVIGQTQHKNLVRLLGFCDQGQNRLLVYEFLPNGTLANFLFNSSKPSWNQRMDMVFAIARGLLYLHEECRAQIIHCDIKPQNILLDDNFNARISDFGLAKLLKLDQSYTDTGIRGTKGYVAPEWFRNKPITAKVDVYSFGVILLEVISCRKSVDMDTIFADRAILTDWAYDCYREGRLDALVDDDIEALSDKVELERYVMVAMWCIQEDPSLRPSMRKVTQMLEGVVEVSVPPCPCPSREVSVS